MHKILRVQLAMEVRLVAFFQAYPFGDGPADDAAARFKTKVERQQELVALQQDGEEARQAQVGKQHDLRQEIIHLPMRHLAGIAAAIRAEEPALSAAIGRPLHQATRQQFLASVASIVATIQAHHDLLRANGMAEETPATLTRLLAEYEQAIGDADAGRRTHTGANAEMRTLRKELMLLVRQLDGLVIFHFRDKPDVLGAWKSARNIAWPEPDPAKPASTPVAVKDQQAPR